MNKGFTLVEVIFSIFVITTLFIPLLHSLVYQVSTSKNASNEVSEKIEQIENDFQMQFLPVEDVEWTIQGVLP